MAPKAKIILTILIIVVLLVVACVAWLLVSGRIPWKSGAEATSTPLTELSQEQKVADIIKTGDLSQCESVKGLVLQENDYYVTCRNNIIFNDALNQLNPSLCDDLDNHQFLIEDCQMQIVAKKMQQNGDLSFCQSIKSQVQISCIQAYWTNRAQSANDVSFCDQLDDSNSQTACKITVYLEQLRKNPVQFRCRLLDGQFYNDCIHLQQLLPSKYNDASCHQLLTADIQSICLELAQKPSTKQQP